VLGGSLLLVPVALGAETPEILVVSLSGMVVPYEESEPESHRSTRLRLEPQIGFAPGGATFGLGGTF
jgi:hypothetical protein